MRGCPLGRNCTSSSGTKQTSWTSSTALETAKCRSTCQYCMVSAWLWLWLVITLVTTSRRSLDDASRTLVRLDRRRAAACRLRFEWKSCELVDR